MVYGYAVGIDTKFPGSATLGFPDRVVYFPSIIAGGLTMVSGCVLFVGGKIIEQLEGSAPLLRHPQNSTLSVAAPTTEPGDRPLGVDNAVAALEALGARVTETGTNAWTVEFAGKSTNHIWSQEGLVSFANRLRSEFDAQS